MKGKAGLFSFAGSALNAMVLAWQGEENRRVQTVQHKAAMDLRREELEHQKIAQHKAAEERRAALQYQAAARLREIYATHEIHKIFEHWPLKLLPSQYGDSNGRDEVVALRAILAFDETLQPMAPRIEEALREYFSLNYPAGSAQRPIEFLGGAWSGRELPGEASTRALHHALGAVPTMLLVVERIGGVIKTRVAYWGIGAAFRYIAVGEVPYAALLAGVARRRAVEWHAAREKLPASGIDAGIHEYNLQLLQQETALRDANMDPNAFAFDERYRIHGSFHHAVEGELAARLAFAGAAIADVHFLVHADTPPLLPSLVRDHNDPSAQAFLASCLVDFSAAYRTLIQERTAWEPELLLDLARTFVLPDKSVALGHLRDSMRAWLAMRGVRDVPDEQLTGHMKPLINASDRSYIENLEALLVDVDRGQCFNVDWSALPPPAVPVRRTVPVVMDPSSPDPFSFGPRHRRRDSSDE